MRIGFFGNYPVIEEHEKLYVVENKTGVKQLPIKGCTCAHCVASTNHDWVVADPNSMYPNHDEWSVEGLKKKNLAGVYDRNHTPQPEEVNDQENAPEEGTEENDNCRAVCRYCGGTDDLVTLHFKCLKHFLEQRLEEMLIER